MSASNEMDPRKLALIRIALVAGVILFAIVSLYTRSQRSGLDAIAELPETLQRTATLRYILYAMAAAAMGVAIWVRSQLDGAPREKQGSLLIVGWAAGESVALFGLVQHFNTGSQTALAIGVMAFAAVLAILPIPRMGR